MIESKDEFSMLGRSLEDLFFFEKDKKLKKQLDKMRKIEETKENIKKITGIENEIVLQKLVDLQIQPQMVISLQLIPLVEVAWADGSVGEKERESILSLNTRDNEVYDGMLDYWLQHKPQPQMLEAWKAYIHGICEKLSDKERDTLKKTLLENATHIAKSEGGGFFGIGSKISRKEADVIKQLKEAFSN